MTHLKTAQGCARSVAEQLDVPTTADSRVGTGAPGAAGAGHRDEEEAQMPLKRRVMTFCLNGYVSRNHVLVLQQLGTNLFS